MWCCPKGRKYGLSICPNCYETSREYSLAMGIEDMKLNLCHVWFMGIYAAAYLWEDNGFTLSKTGKYDVEDVPKGALSLLAVAFRKARKAGFDPGDPCGLGGGMVLSYYRELTDKQKRHDRKILEMSKQTDAINNATRVVIELKKSVPSLFPR